MKKLFADIRKQNIPDLSLDRAILEKAKTMRAGKKIILSEHGKEQNDMKIFMNKDTGNETALVKRNYSALIAAAAAVVLVVGGAVFAANTGKIDIEPTASAPAASAPAETESGTEGNNDVSPVTPVSDSSEQETPEADESKPETAAEDSSSSQPEQTTAPETAVPETKNETDSSGVKDWAKSYLEINPDTIGYINIPGFDDSDEKIDYPVVQRSDVSWAYYFNHDFYGNESQRGAIVRVRDRSISTDYVPDNIVLQGYNAIDEDYDAYNSDDNKMFTGLKQYQKGLEFFKEHALINFKTIYEDDGEYVVFAVLNHDGNKEQIYTAPNFESEAEFDEWITAVKKNSYFSADINCTADDQYLTLITPVHPEDDSALYRTVIAKKLTPSDDKLAIINSADMHSPETESPASSELTELRLEIPLPQGVRGSYVFDVYREGTNVYSKTITEAEDIAGEDVYIFVTGKNSEELVVYVKSIDLGADNYIKYVSYNVDYENKTITQTSEPDYDKLLKITPAE